MIQLARCVLVWGQVCRAGVGGGCSSPRTVVVCTNSQEDFLCLFAKLVRRVGGVCDGPGNNLCL